MKKRGFTLIELLVAVAILAILSSVGLSTFIGSQKKARDARRRADLKSIQNALEQYYLTNNAYYTSYYYNLGTTYFPNGVPQDPRFSAYYYQPVRTSTSYRVSACLEITANCTSVSTREDVSIRQLQ